ncbi:MAG TPA: DNA primase [Candidatus Saccharimonas sp.]|jgi:DNA primase|nr:DNA primase [Candidatus Saccharimonas sp.]
MDAKEEVRAKIAIEDVIGEYVQLKRAGRNFKGLSPFSGEKTASFFVSPEKNIWHDFSSNKGGDVFAFVMEVEGMDFRAALEHLARKAGVDLSLYENQSTQELAKRKRRLIEANALAARYYQQSLLRNQHAKDYVVTRRGFNQSIVQSFMLGYAPDTGSALTTALAKSGYKKQEMADAGLTNRYGGDMFRGRMMVPLMDASGQVIGFTGRIIGDVPGAPKYLNTSQTLLYDKSRHVFGFSQAKEAIRRSGYVVVVEGNLDVVSSHQAGIAQVVATAGTAMTEHHLRALKRLTPDVRLAFDGDKAGIAATERAIAIAGQVGVELTIVSLPAHVKDPDELIREDPKQWQQAIDTRQPAVDWVLAQYVSRVDMNTAAGKRAFTTAALDVVRLLSDPVEQEHYEQKIATMTGTSLQSIHAKFERQPTEQKTLKPVTVRTVERPPEALVHQDDVLAATCLDVSSQDAFGHMNLDMFVGEERRAVAGYFAAHPGNEIEDTPPELHKYDTYVKILLLRAEARYAGMDAHERVFETARLLRLIETEHKKHRQQELIEKLRKAEADGDDTTADELRVTLNTLIKEIPRGKR